MNLYLRLADQIGTIAARDLAAQLVSWHDAMVKHARVVGLQQTEKCGDECPHVDAPALWAAACDTFGERASGLVFLERHGARGRSLSHAGATTRLEVRP